MQNSVLDPSVENTLLFIARRKCRCQSLEEGFDDGHVIDVSRTSRGVDYIETLRRAYLQIHHAREQPVGRCTFIKNKKPRVRSGVLAEHFDERLVKILRERYKDTSRQFRCSLPGF